MTVSPYCGHWSLSSDMNWSECMDFFWLYMFQIEDKSHSVEHDLETEAQRNTFHEYIFLYWIYLIVGIFIGILEDLWLESPLIIGALPSPCHGISFGINPALTTFAQDWRNGDM